MTRLRSSQARPDPSGPQSLASTERIQRRGRGSRNDNPTSNPPPPAVPVPQDPVGHEVNQDILDKQAAAYVEAIRLRMISQGIPFEAVGVVENLNHRIRIPVFDRLGPPPPTPISIQQEDLRPRLVKSAVEAPPRRAQTPARPRAKAKASHPDAEGSTGSRKSHGGKRHQENKWKARNQGDQAQKRGEEGEDLTRQTRVIHTISGGPTLAGTSNNSRKSYAREIPRLNASVDEFIVSDEARDPPHSTRIIFSGEDAHDSTQPHDDPMVISIQVAN